MVVKVELKGNKKIHESNVNSWYVEDSILHIEKESGVLQIPMSDIVSCIANTPSNFVEKGLYSWNVNKGAVGV